MYRSYRNFKLIYSVLMIFLLIGVSFNIFNGLEKFPITSWDEARHGVSAYEMLKTGNYIINTYRDKIDYWNLKPPLSFWADIAGYKIAGYNVIGLRLFSGIFAILTVISIALFVYKKHGKLASLLSTLVLITCQQFIINHSARTGDADSLFVFLFSLAILSILLFEQNSKWLYASGFLFALGFLTKSWHACNIAFIIGLNIILTGKYRAITLKNWFLLFSCMVLPIAVWVGIRYQYDGIKFLQGMILYDLLKRSSTSIEGHIGGKVYYFQVIWEFFKYWLILLFGSVLLLFNKDFLSKVLKYKNYLIGICLWVLVPFILFTVAKTKIRWYILPIYPPLSIIIGAATSKLLKNGKTFKKVALILSFLFVSIYYEWQIQAFVNNPTTNLKLDLLQKIQSIDNVKGYSLFLYQPSRRTAWTQNAVLAAELYGDLHLDNRDFNYFLKKDQALLLVKKRKDTEQLIKSHHLNVIVSNRWGYIVGKAVK